PRWAATPGSNRHTPTEAEQPSCSNSSPPTQTGGQSRSPTPRTDSRGPPPPSRLRWGRTSKRLRKYLLRGYRASYYGLTGVVAARRDAWGSSLLGDATLDVLAI